MSGTGPDSLGSLDFDSIIERLAHSQTELQQAWDEVDKKDEALRQARLTLRELQSSFQDLATRSLLQARDAVDAMRQKTLGAAEQSAQSVEKLQAEIERLKKIIASTTAVLQSEIETKAEPEVAPEEPCGVEVEEFELVAPAIEAPAIEEAPDLIAETIEEARQSHQEISEIIAAHEILPLDEFSSAKTTRIDTSDTASPPAESAAEEEPLKDTDDDEFICEISAAPAGKFDRLL